MQHIAWVDKHPVRLGGHPALVRLEARARPVIPAQVSPISEGDPPLDPATQWLGDMDRPVTLAQAASVLDADL